MSPETLKLGVRVKVATINDDLLKDVPFECESLIKNRSVDATGEVAYISPRQGPIPIFVVVQHDPKMVPAEQQKNVRAPYHCDELEPIRR